MAIEYMLYLAGASISIILWIIALFRLNSIFSGSTALLIGKVLTIISLIVVDLIIILGFFHLLDREQFRLSMLFLTGVQIVAALSVSTGRRN